MTREEISALLESYRDGTVTAQEGAALAHLLDAGGEEARFALTHWAVMGQLSQALDGVDGDAMAASFQERLRAETSGSRIVRGVERLRAADARGHGISSRRAVVRHRRRFQPGALAAAAVVLILVVLGAGLMHRGGRQAGHLAVDGLANAPDSLHVSALSGAGSRITSGHQRPLLVGDRLDAGDRLVVAAGGSALLRYADGSELTIDAGSALELLPAATGKRLRLVAGELHAQVAHQPAGTSLVVETAFASCEVIGTTFAIAAGADTTRLTVFAGRVRLVAGADKVEVAANQYALAAPGIVLAVHDLNAPAIPLPAAPVARLLDGFELPSAWSHEPYSGPLTFARSQEHVHTGSWSMRIGYQRDVSDLKPYAQLLRPLLLQPPDRTIRLWLWSEQIQAEARWQLQLHDRDNCYWKTTIREFDASPGWHEVRIAIPAAPERAFAPPGHENDPFNRDHIDALALNFFGGDAVIFIDDIDLLAEP